jgi:CRP-like cAMP-binding protein
VQWRTGETLIREGDRAEALFVIATGVADVTVGTRSVHRLIPGETLGAISLVKRAQYASTVTALTELRAYRLAKDGIAAATEACPAVAVALEALARRGQDALRANAATGQAEDVHPEMSPSRLRSLLRVLAK